MTAWEHIVTDGYPVPVTGVGFQRSAFGQLLTESLIPRAGWTFPYNQINTRLVATSNSGTGAGVGVVDGIAVVTSGTDPTGYATLRTRKALRYTNGVGGRCTVAGIFAEGNGSNVVSWRIRLNSTLTGTNYTPLSAANSVCSADTTGTVTQTAPGELVWSRRMGRNTGDWANVQDLSIYLAPGDVLTVEAETATSVTASVSIQLHEEW